MARFCFILAVSRPYHAIIKLQVQLCACDKAQNVLAEK